MSNSNDWNDSRFHSAVHSNKGLMWKGMSEMNGYWQIKASPYDKPTAQEPKEGTNCGICLGELYPLEGYCNGDGQVVRTACAPASTSHPVSLPTPSRSRTLRETRSARSHTTTQPARTHADSSRAHLQVFHVKCLSKWLRHDYKRGSCPSCRSTILVDVYHLDSSDEE